MQKETAAELELNLKKKARRRLVGAVALVMLMLVVLPFVLQDREAITTEAQVKITIDNEAVRFPGANKPPAIQRGFDSSIVAVESSSELESDAAAKPAENSTETPVKSQSGDLTTMQSAPDEKASQPKAVAKTDEAATAVVPPAHRASANDMASNPNQPRSNLQANKDKNATFFVQVGIFTDPENVKKLQAKLADLGYQSKTEKINTPKGEKIRLKTQTFSSRNEAANALEGIKQANLPGMVVSQ